MFTFRAAFYYLPPYHCTGHQTPLHQFLQEYYYPPVTPWSIRSVLSDSLTTVTSGCLLSPPVFPLIFLQYSSVFSPHQLLSRRPLPPVLHPFVRSILLLPPYTMIQSHRLSAMLPPSHHHHSLSFFLPPTLPPLPSILPFHLLHVSQPLSTAQ